MKSSRKKKLNVILVILLAFGLIGTALGVSGAVGKLLAFSVPSNAIFSDDFSSGNLNAWQVIGSPLIVTSPTFSGNSYAASFTSSGDYIGYSSSGYSDLFVSFDVYFSPLPTGSDTYANFLYMADSGDANAISMQVTDQWNLWDGTTNSYAGGLVAGQWFNVQMERLQGSGDGAINVWIDGVQIFSETGLTITNSGSNVYVGQIFSSAYTNIYVDNVIIAPTYINSNSIPTPTPTLTPTATPTPTLTPTPTINPTATPTSPPTITPTPPAPVRIDINKALIIGGIATTCLSVIGLIFLNPIIFGKRHW